MFKPGVCFLHRTIKRGAIFASWSARSASATVILPSLNINLYLRRMMFYKYVFINNLATHESDDARWEAYRREHVLDNGDHLGVAYGRLRL